MSAQLNVCLTYLCLVDAAVSLQLPDVVLLHPPPGVLRVPVWGSFHLLAHIFARPAKNERLPARVHPQESGHVVHPGPQQHPAGILGAVASHLPLREDLGGHGRRHPDSGDAKRPPEVKTEHRGDQKHLPVGLTSAEFNFTVNTQRQQNS